MYENLFASSTDQSEIEMNQSCDLWIHQALSEIYKHM